MPKRIPYVPEPAGKIATPEEMFRYIQRELERISIEITLTLGNPTEFLHVPPNKVFEGLVVGADGSDWDPTGEGQGMYAYYGDAWHKLSGSGDTTIINIINPLPDDHTHQGEIETGVLGEAMEYGDLMFLDTDEKWYMTDASDVDTSAEVMLAFCLQDGAEDDTVPVLLDGRIRADDKFGGSMTPGKTAFIGLSPGTIVQGDPLTVFDGEDEVIRAIGEARSATDLLFRPSRDHGTRTIV